MKCRSDFSTYRRRPCDVSALELTEAHADGFAVAHAHYKGRRTDVLAETRAGAERAAARLGRKRGVTVRPFVYLGERRAYFEAGDWLVVWPNGARSVYAPDAFAEQFEENEE